MRGAMLSAANDIDAGGPPALPTVAIVDFDTSARSATRCLLESEGYRVLSHASLASFLRASPSSAPDCLLLDIRVPGREGLEMLRQLAEYPDRPPILVASASADLDLAVAAMKLGAADFIQKPYAPRELLRAIEALAPADDIGLPGAKPDEMARLVEALPRRQRQILAGIVRGVQNKVIAWELELSVRTVEYYRAQMFRRLGIRSVAEAVRIGVAAGLGKG